MLVTKKVKNIVPWTYAVSELNGEEIVGTFYEKELQKTNQKEFGVEKVNYMLNGKAIKILLTIRLIKKEIV